ncbi:response regulator transcription factor [Bifidobacterium sp.]|jgi:DNA-binding NarL/FixJ family response regulator|uniref:response regulator transcription factor n=1 Tax=Bifidobacterium sp. TaxID=41200 RepID=UPI0025BE410B|nr:response regulator transcription factor [Bifidobacterium sp.]MCH4210065.1 response regulator transcription factor [Bifidobacterium sp.]MCI1225346.1 response regulator transcription factor [Bifidobacterium sp.]
MQESSSGQSPHDAEKPITVGIVDDDPMICQLMKLSLSKSSQGSISVPFTATDGRAAVTMARSTFPDVVLVDIAMPAMDGIEVTKLMRTLNPPPHILILTSLSPAETVERAVEAGAEGFVSKADDARSIVDVVIDVCRGNPQFNLASQRQLITEIQAQQPHSRRNEARSLLGALPKREREAVVYAAEGYTNAEIAMHMIISERTVKADLSSASRKLQMGRVQMARLVERADLKGYSIPGAAADS